VIPIATNGNVDIAPALITVSAGDYTAQLTTLAALPNAPAIVSGRLEWRQRKMDAHWKPRVVPGLYRLSLIDKDGNPAGSATVLASSSLDYAENASLFARFQVFANRLGIPRDPRVTLDTRFLLALWSDHDLIKRAQ
jgi:hypothetical protein